MEILSYNYLDRIRDLQGKEKAYTAYLQSEFYGKKLKEVLTETNRPVIETIAKGNAETYAALDRLDGRLGEINNNLIDGFEEISFALDDANIKLDELLEETIRAAGIMDWGFHTLIEQQRVSHLLLQDIGTALRIPDFEKERIHYIEKGLQQLKKAIFDADFYGHAEDCFKEALQRDSTDHFTLMRLGLIHLFTPKGANFVLSSEYLEKSIKSIRPEVLGNPGDKELKKKLSLIAYYLGTVNMLCGTYEKAKALLEESLNAYPSFEGARYQLCKAKHKLADDTFLEELKMLIHSSPLYFTKTLYDPDFKGTGSVGKMLEHLMQQKSAPVKLSIQNIKESIHRDSNYTQEIRSIEDLAGRSYLGVLKARHLLEKSRETTFYKPVNSKADDLKNGRIATNEVRVNGTLLDLVKSESRYKDEYAARKSQYENNIGSYRLAEENRRNKENREFKHRQQTNLIIQCVLVPLLAFFFMIMGKSIKNAIADERQFIPAGLGEFISAYPVYITLWILFGVFVGICIVKALFSPSSLQGLRSESAMTVSMIFSVINGLIFASDNWKRDADFFEWIGNAFAFVIVVLVCMGVGAVLGKVLSLLLEKK